jgi:hypothetical protein
MLNATKKRILSILLTASMIVGIITAMPLTVFANDVPFPHQLYAHRNIEGAIQVNSSGFSINGDMATNGTFRTTARHPNLAGRRVENAGLEMIRIPNRINETFFSGSNVEIRNGNHTAHNYTQLAVNNPLAVVGNANLTGVRELSLRNSIKASGDIILNGENVNANTNITIFSEHGDVIINGHNNAAFNSGLIYAPNGNVVFNARNVTFNGIIIAQTITFNNGQNINIGRNNSVSRFVGIVSEPVDNNCDDCGESPCTCPAEGVVCIGGIIAPPRRQGLTGSHVINGNALRNNISVLDINVMDLINGTCINAGDIRGIQAEIWAPQANTRQIYFEVNGVQSPMFETNTANPARIHMPREAVHTVTHTFNAVNSANFNVRIRANNAVWGVGWISLLDINGNVLGKTFYSTQNALGTWSGFSAACGCNLEYELTDSIARITGFKGENYNPNLVIPHFLEGNRVSRIRPGAFEGTSITTLTLPSGMRVIDDLAFADCTELTKITLTAPSTNIGNAAFYGCSSLERLVVADNAADTRVSVHIAAFADSGLTEIVDVGGNCMFDRVLFGGNERNDEDEIEWQDGSFAFFRTPLASIRSGLNPSVEVIPMMAFGETAMTSIVIPDTVRIIETSAFRGSAIETVVFEGDGLELIEDFAFADCFNLVEVLGLDGVDEVSEWAFVGSLFDFDDDDFAVTRYVSVGDWVVQFREMVGVSSPHITIVEYNGSSGDITIPPVLDGHRVTNMTGNIFQGNENLVSLTIPDGLKEEWHWTFKDCINLESVSLGADVTRITGDSGRGMFENCISLRSITIPNNVTSIGQDAFANSGLTSIVLHANIESIGYRAFADCKYLETVIFRSSNPPTVIPVTFTGYSVFSGSNNLNIFVPRNSVELYREAGFRNVVGICNENCTLPVGTCECSPQSACRFCGNYGDECTRCRDCNLHENCICCDNQCDENCVKCGLPTRTPTNCIICGNENYDDCDCCSKCGTIDGNCVCCSYPNCTSVNRNECKIHCQDCRNGPLLTDCPCPCLTCKEDKQFCTDNRICLPCIKEGCDERRCKTHCQDHTCDSDD